MRSVEEAVEAAAKAWHDRSEESAQEEARETLEYASGDDQTAFSGYLDQCRETLACGPMSWEDCPEFGKEIARSKVRQTVLDALPAFLYAEAEDARMRADMFYTPAIEESHLKWMAREIEETAKEIENESSN